jgi:hypothetical protein
MARSVENIDARLMMVPRQSMNRAGSGSGNIYNPITNIAAGVTKSTPADRFVTADVTTWPKEALGRP